MKEQHEPSTGAITVSLLEIAFIVLKLCGVIEWSWWWVLSPLWLTTAICVVLVLVLVVVASITCSQKDKESDAE